MKNIVWEGKQQTQARIEGVHGVKAKRRQREADAETQKKAKRQRQAAERDERNRRERLAKKQKLSHDLNQFISVHCLIGKGLFTETTQFKQAFETSMDSRIGSQESRQKMEEHGFTYQRERKSGRRVRVFTEI